MATTNDPTRIMVKCRIQAPHLYEPFTDRFEKTRYSVILRVYDKAEQEKIEAAKIAAAKAKWPAEWEKKLKKINGNDNNKLLRESEDGDYMFLKATRRPEDGMPKLVGRDRHTVAQSEGLFVSGAFVNALISLWAYDNQSTGISATLLGVQWVKEGEPFADAPMAAEDDFGDLDAGKESEPTEDIPW